MSGIWYAIPSANAPQCGECFAQWKARGYHTAVLIDGDTPVPANADVVLWFKQYHGYGWAVNRLCWALSDAEWIITGGDDITPGDHDPARVASECREHFAGTFGVMQPTGDPWNDYCIAKCAGSPWMGREYRLRANMGRGPFWEEYGHLYDDTELLNVATRKGVYWMRPDLIHMHEHWTKKGIPKPPYLAHANEARSKALFEQRRALNFPGAEFLPQRFLG